MHYLKVSKVIDLASEELEYVVERVLFCFHQQYFWWLRVSYAFANCMYFLASNLRNSNLFFSKTKR